MAAHSAPLFQHHCYTAIEAVLLKRDALRKGAVSYPKLIRLVAVLFVASVVVAVGIDISVGAGLFVIALGLALVLEGRYSVSLEASLELAGLRPVSNRSVKRLERMAEHLPELRYSLDRWKAGGKVIRVRDYRAALAHFELTH